MLGIGRIGAAGSPILAGLLFSWLGNDQLLAVSVIMATGSIVAALLLFILPLARRRSGPGMTRDYKRIATEEAFMTPMVRDLYRKGDRAGRHQATRASSACGGTMFAGRARSSTG